MSIAAAIFTAPVGWFAARFGRKEFFLVLACGVHHHLDAVRGLAQTLSQEVIFRLLQGLVSARRSWPLSQAIMLDIYPVEQRGTGDGHLGNRASWSVRSWGLRWAAGLTDSYDWRWVFFINLPFGIIAVVGVMLFLKEAARECHPALRLDRVSWALSLGLGAMQLMFDRGLDQGLVQLERDRHRGRWLAGLGFYIFIVHMFTAEEAVHSAADFQGCRISFPASRRCLWSAWCCLASSALLPPYLQNLGNYTVTDVGFHDGAARGVGAMLVMMVCRPLSPRSSIRAF